MGRHVSVIAALLLAGCAWHGPVPAQTYPGIEPSANVVTLDKAAYKLVAVKNQVVARRDDGLLNVRLELVNLSSKDLAVQIQTLFRDTTNMPSGEDTPFQMVVLPGGGFHMYEVTSLTADAASYTVQIKTP